MDFDNLPLFKVASDNLENRAAEMLAPIGDQLKEKLSNNELKCNCSDEDICIECLFLEAEQLLSENFNLDMVDEQDIYSFSEIVEHELDKVVATVFKDNKETV
jgi:hypothetical protein